MRRRSSIQPRKNARGGSCSSPQAIAPDALQKLGMAALSPQLAFGPARGAVPEGALAFTAHADGARADLAAMLAHAYPLEELAQEYRAFLHIGAGDCRPAQANPEKPRCKPGWF